MNKKNAFENKQENTPPERPRVYENFSNIFLKNDDKVYIVLRVGWDYLYDPEKKTSNPGVTKDSLMIAEYYDRDNWKWVDIEKDVDKKRSNI